MRFNLDHYREYRRAAGYSAKNGVYDVTRFPNGRYCFATKQWLGDNGKLDVHEWYGVKLKCISTGEVFTIDSVNIHWDKGFYYFVTMVNSKGSHSNGFIRNINCKNQSYLGYIADFWNKWELN